MSPANAKNEYSAKNLDLVEGLRHVRMRPHMYINSTGNQGLHHLVEEIVANSVDEAMAGYCTEICVEVEENGWVTVRDNGRGIPVDIHEKSGLSGLELVLTKLGGGGKFGGEESGYKVSGGLHGVGSSVVNALSREMKATVWRDGFEWTQTYKEGVPEGPVKKGGKSDKTGTQISWLFDEGLFDKGVKYDKFTVGERLRELSFLNTGLKFTLRFHGGKEQVFHSKDGLAGYLKSLVAEKDSNDVQAVHRAPVVLQGAVTETREFDGKEIEDTTEIDIALYWTTADPEVPHTFVNSVRTPKGGDHYDGLRSGLRKAINEAAEELGKFRAKDSKFEQADTREGLFLAIAVRVSEPRFESQAKLSLQNPEVQKRVSNFVSQQLKDFLIASANAGEADSIIQRVIQARDGRIAAANAKANTVQRKGLLGASGLASKLADCQSKDLETTEIYLVEGDSAGGSMKQKRDRATQAVLPLRGKIQNAEKSGEATLASDAIKDILAALGGVVSTTQVEVKKNGKMTKKIKQVVDLSEPRYGKIIMCCDADVDGGHIVTLLLTFFYRFAPQLITDGRLWVCELPLYRIEHKKQGRLYLYTDEDLERYMKRDEIKKRQDGTPDVSRFKGLGEMQPDQLKELALDTEKRRLRQVLIEDAGDADDMTSMLMGSRVERRREYIEEHALSVEADI